MQVVRYDDEVIDLEPLAVGIDLHGGVRLATHQRLQTLQRMQAMINFATKKNTFASKSVESQLEKHSFVIQRKP